MGVNNKRVIKTCILFLFVFVCLRVHDCYTGENPIELFFEELAGEDERITNDLQHIRPMNMLAEEQQQFENVNECWICSDELGDDRVRDHDHITGKYRGAAHSKCNINLRITPETLCRRHHTLQPSTAN